MLYTPSYDLHDGDVPCPACWRPTRPLWGVVRDVQTKSWRKGGRRPVNPGHPGRALRARSGLCLYLRLFGFDRFSPLKHTRALRPGVWNLSSVCGNTFMVEVKHPDLSINLRNNPESTNPNHLVPLNLPENDMSPTHPSCKRLPPLVLIATHNPPKYHY